MVYKHLQLRPSYPFRVKRRLTEKIGFGNLIVFPYLLSYYFFSTIQVMQLRKACSHPYLFPGIEPEPYEEGEHLVQVSNLVYMLVSVYLTKMLLCFFSPTNTKD